MGFFKKLFNSDSGGSEELLHYRIKCDHCGEIVEITVRSSSELQTDLDDPEGGYELNKEVQDSKCFRIMKLTARFSRTRQALSADVQGGKLVTD